MCIKVSFMLYIERPHLLQTSWICISCQIADMPLAGLFLLRSKTGICSTSKLTVQKDYSFFPLTELMPCNVLWDTKNVQILQFSMHKYSDFYNNSHRFLVKLPCYCLPALFNLFLLLILIKEWIILENLYSKWKKKLKNQGKNIFFFLLWRRNFDI